MLILIILILVLAVFLFFAFQGDLGNEIIKSAGEAFSGGGLQPPALPS
jgi:hypothetical protein